MVIHPDKTGMRKRTKGGFGGKGRRRIANKERQEKKGGRKKDEPRTKARKR
jgi:phosphoribosylaminoimidazole carboxylase (NCAIR synthetase)